ncbi:MAG TPA: aminotransferase class V-fold PLP-dependent enzyme [Thermoanaerobaculia bacterium]
MPPRLVDAASSAPRGPVVTDSPAAEAAFLERLRRRVIGADAVIPGPSGEFPLRYFDFIASGRFHRDVEDELNERVLPFMANTHTEGNFTGARMTELYHGALQKIGAYVGATANDAVIPVGSGSTGAINRLIHVLGLRLPDQLDERFGLSARIPPEGRPVVFRSLMEHHSNDIAWRETIGDSVYVEFDAAGRISLEDLDRKLSAHANRPWKIGTFSAASNVTGILNDVHSLARVLHRHGALAFFDYAAAGPYVDVDIHPAGDPEGALDAVFFSVHKFLGGPRTPGLLVAHRRLFTNRVPAEPGGGTVLYTSPWDHRYLGAIESRETGGTPPIVQTIQAGLAFDLKAAVGEARTERVERDYLRRAITAWRGRDDLYILGNLETRRLGVLSVIFRQVHHHLAARLLNDLFGIQVRAGCMCAGPYGHLLLHIDEEHSKTIRHRLDEGHLGEKPGWVRISLSPTVSEDEFQALLEGVDHVARRGRELSEDYTQSDETGEWAPRTAVPAHGKEPT